MSTIKTLTSLPKSSLLHRLISYFISNMKLQSHYSQNIFFLRGIHFVHIVCHCSKRKIYVIILLYLQRRLRCPTSLAFLPQVSNHYLNIQTLVQITRDSDSYPAINLSSEDQRYRLVSCCKWMQVLLFCCVRD